MAGMIIFNGVDLEDVASVKIDDIKVNPIQTSATARQRVGMGQDFVRMTGSNRTVTITFALLTNDIDKRYKELMDIQAWCDPYKEHDLSLPMYEGERHLECICTGYPEPSYRQWWESKLRLVFTTFENPYWTSDDEIRAQCGTAFSVGGTAPPLMRIERNVSSRIANQTYSCNGKSMFFSQVPAGKLVIDLNKQTASVGSASIMQYFGTTSKFIIPTTGRLTVKGSGTIIYRERWV